MMFQLSAKLASMKRLIRNCTRNGDSTAGALARSRHTTAALATKEKRFFSTLPSLPEKAGGAQNQDENEKPEAQKIGIRRSQVRGGEGLDHAEHQATHQRTQHGAEATKHVDGEGLEREGAAHRRC